MVTTEGQLAAERPESVSAHPDGPRVWRILRFRHSGGPGALRALTQIGITVLSLGIATALALFFRSLGITETSIVMLYLLSVVIASVTTGRVMGIIASVVAVVLFNFLFTEPRFTFVVNDTQYLVTFPVMLTVAAISSELTARIRQQATEAERREHQTKLLYESSRALLGARGTETVAAAALHHLAGLIHRRVHCAVPGSDDDPQVYGLETGKDSERYRHDCARLFRAGGSASEEWIEHDGELFLYLPVRSHHEALAVLIVDCGTERLPAESLASLSAVAVQLALALDRERMSQKAEDARVETERERLRANLLQSISHDLRSPLAAITGAASAVLDGSLGDGKSSREMITSIRDDARWLAGLVENLLSLTRAEESTVRISGSLEVLDDVLSSALSRMERIHATHSLSVDLDAEPVLVRMDGGLMEQLILNLLDNAATHTPAGTHVRVTIGRLDGNVTLVVEDDGPGLSRHALRHAFERFFTDKPVADGRRGMGLGLAICKSIAEAHGGSISASNCPAGGARFEVRLPAQPDSGSMPPIDAEV